jgi:hypothetical protein
MDLNQSIRKAITIFQQHQQTDDIDVLETLVAEGIDRSLARRLLLFVPMAFCRLMFGSRGVKFEDEYLVVDENAKPIRRGTVSTEPVYIEAVNVFGVVVAARPGGDFLLAVAARSAELRAINEMALSGSKLADIVLTAPHVMGAFLQEDVEQYGEPVDP